MAVLLLPASALHPTQQLPNKVKDCRVADGSKTPTPAGLLLPASAFHHQQQQLSNNAKDFRAADESKTPVSAMKSRSLMDFRMSDGSRTPANMTPALISRKRIASDGSRTPFWNAPTPCRSPSSSSLLFRLGPRRRTVSNSSSLSADPFQLQDSTPVAGDLCIESNNPQSIPNQKVRVKGQMLCKSGLSVAVVAPGGGTGINSSVYSALDREYGISVKVLGQSRAAYDRYPAAWGNDGAPAPNLETFALDLAAQKCFDQADCLIVGSRGGQVVLPILWKAKVDVPPTIVMNGGCAMSLPIAANSSTAILLVNEMSHMPQAQLLTSILSTIIGALKAWKCSGEAPWDDFKTLLAILRQGKWTGAFSVKATPGDKWDSETFP
eukprot:CAMPEP_0169068864 /NCGR_PEP_ID=MMETSP1015-20121227/4256_1 /TAXON_ID=342587 /ORGANISM="Karlodinium micrum, Strain CCMP2283" /LENGTH=379 /DNA_ID=CAMNT_0009127717 /DNA_START=52 /DNA_END=1191 /DNA_ORIENTATION=+